jgi:hypothetical protein
VFDHLNSSGDGSPDPDCGADPIAALKTMFVDIVMGRRLGGGQKPALRPVFLKPHGIAGGTFAIEPGLPEELRVGVFAGESFPAWVRFSSDTTPTTPDAGKTCGIAIKLCGVPGITTHDFLLQNHDVFFVDTAQAMCEFTYAGVVGSGYGPYLAAHPKTAGILDAMKKTVPSVLGTDYWSGLPYRFGDGRHAKYKIVPAGASAAPPAGLSADDPDYLRADLRHRLLEHDATFHFCVQLRTDEKHMPLDEATVAWSESASPPIHVATLTLPRQDVDAPGQAEWGENLAFDTWRTLPEHEPVGSVAEARRVAYRAAAELRRERNGVSTEEPPEPRPLEDAARSLDTTIVRAAIHPAIGIARVGNSEEHFFCGPEVDEPKPEEPGFYKDEHGALKRQAARFRIYGLNAAGEVVRELTADDAEIEWTVHVANTKAAWYQFQIALDIPEARRKDVADPSALRNGGVLGGDRSKLVIDPGPRTISGREAGDPGHRFDTGTFWGKKVYLGELRTDEDGRLLFLGGRGVSAAYDGSSATTFANNDKWHDDVSDGPVTASVRIDGRPIEVDPAWVAVAPPNYGPDLQSPRTMYDLLFDAYVQAGWIAVPERVSFARDVLPVLRRMCGLQWVNRGIAAQHGWGGRENFLDPEYVTKLASGREEHAELRQQVWMTFRDWERDGTSPVPWPWMYGDSMNLPPVSERQHVTLSQTQMLMLERWAEGDFETDYDPDLEPPGTLADVPVSEQPATLDRAALSFCLADAFHPGCELTWPMRHPTMYMAPFRIRHRAIADPERSYGTRLTPDVALAVDGPLYGQSPGSLTRWMAVPWQTDTASCRSGYYMGYGPRYDPYVPTFWPARVPNQVLTRKSYEIVMDESRPLGERQKAFEERAAWLRWLEGGYLAQVNQMVRDFGKLGVVEALPGPADGAFGAWILVESEVGWEKPVPLQRNLRTLHVPQAAGLEPEEAEAEIERARDASPHPNEEITAGYIDKVERFRA